MPSRYERLAFEASKNPITYRMLHEHAAGQGLCPEFFQISGIDPDASVTCNCKWDGGHESTCDLVAANELLANRNTRRQGEQS